MKRILLFICFVTMFLAVSGQVPQAFNYQAILRNSDGTIKVNEIVVLQISIIHSLTDGPPVYTEAHNTITSELGLVNLVIGEGETSDELSLIDWANGPYYLEISVNDINMGTSPLLSVPYALYAASGNEGPPGPPGIQGLPGLKGEPGDTKWSETPEDISYLDGNVGIGTANPQSNLHIHGSPLLSDMRGQLSLSSPLGNDVWLSFYEDNQYKAYLWWDANEGALRLQNRSMGDLSLNSAGGNVGIGTKDPIETLHVNGNTQIEGDLIVHGDVIMKDLMAEMQMLKDMAGIGSLTDIDGNVYKTVKIGDQIWMAENLKVTHYNDSTPLGVMWYDLNINNKDIYGGIYHYVYEKVCPVGWHVSTGADWAALINYIGDSSTAGKLMETGIEHWFGPNEFATNETGFTALPGGFYLKTYPHNERDEEGNWITPESFHGLGEEARFWAPEINVDAWDLSDFIGIAGSRIGYSRNVNEDDVTICGSIRCVKD